MPLQSGGAWGAPSVVLGRGGVGGSASPGVGGTGLTARIPGGGDALTCSWVHTGDKSHSGTVGRVLAPTCD